MNEYNDMNECDEYNVTTQAHGWSVEECFDMRNYVYFKQDYVISISYFLIIRSEVFCDVCRY
jgi:hypothetical protein